MTVVYEEVQGKRRGKRVLIADLNSKGEGKRYTKKRVLSMKLREKDHQTNYRDPFWSM